MKQVYRPVKLTSERTKGVSTVGMVFIKRDRTIALYESSCNPTRASRMGQEVILRLSLAWRLVILRRRAGRLVAGTISSVCQFDEG